MNDPILVIRNLSKTFPGQRALDNVSMDVMPGEVHALVGENGSGKSTLVKCLSGFHQPDAGSEITIRGRTLTKSHDAKLAGDLGMTFVHQDLGLIPSLSVFENFCLGRGFSTGVGYHIRWREDAARVQKLITEFGSDVSPFELIRNLSMANKTIIAIVRALDWAPTKMGHLLVVDEPTAALPRPEVEQVLAAIRQSAAAGAGVIYISHRLEEVFAIADRVTVLRDGRTMGTFRLADLDEGKLVELIVGRPLDTYYPQMESRIGEDMLLRTNNLSGIEVKDVSFSIKNGEIVGLAGLLGSGCSEVGRLLFGAERPTTGGIFFKGKEISFHHPSDAIKRGIILVTEERTVDGCFPRMTIGENITITDLNRFWKWGRIQRRAERRELADIIDKFRVNPSDFDRLFNTLSGGNQQKAVLAKWMRLKPNLMILDEPVKGIDVGTKAEVYRFMKEAATEGAGLLLISSEFEDMAHVCDRVLVMANGRIVGELAGEQIKEEHIAQLSYLSNRRNEPPSPI
jgi:ABC-type sugar transport system ATPase subunit